MGYLTINRKKQSGKGFKNCVIVTIDDAQIFEIANGENKKIYLPEGKHHIKLSYECDPCDEMPFMKAVPFVNMLQANCMHEEDFNLTEVFEYNISMELNKFNIKTSEGKVKTYGEELALMYFLKKICLSSIPLWLSFILTLIATSQIWNFPMMTVASSLAYSAILFIVPLIVNIVKTYKADFDTRKNLDGIFYRYFKHALIALFTIIGMMLLVEILLSNFTVVYFVISLILASIAEVIIILNDFNAVRAKLIGVLLVVALIFTGVTALFPKSTSTDPDGVEGWTECYKCGKTGKVRNDFGIYVICPRCDGVGYLPD